MMKGSGSVKLGESKLNLWRFDHFCTHLVETHMMDLEDDLRLIRSRPCSITLTWADLFLLFL